MELKPRLCTLYKWDANEGYGFSLKAEKGKVGQFIKDVDLYSPAHFGGLKDDDFLVEVNGSNILRDTHADVVKKIKKHNDRVTMLVLDPKSREFYDSKSVAVTSKLPEVMIITCPKSPPKPDKIQQETKSLDLPEKVEEEKGELKRDIVKTPDSEPQQVVREIISQPDEKNDRKESLPLSIEETTNLDENNDYDQTQPEQFILDDHEGQYKRNDYPDSAYNQSGEVQDWRNSPNLEKENQNILVNDPFSMSVEEIRSRISKGNKRKEIKKTTKSFKERTEYFEQL